MEVSINLLPQSNNRQEKRPVYLIPIIGITAVLAAASFLTYSYFDSKNSIKTLSETINAKTTIRDQLLNDYKTKTNGVSEFNFIDKYQQLDKFLQSIYVNSSDLQDSLKRLLPVQADVVSYSYSNEGDLTVTVNFYSKGDSAVYLHRLLQANFVQKAEMVSITANDKDLTYNAVYQMKLNTLAGGEK
ncbi:hypothetical protein [Neobacillus mesonae]|uniref:hypothetical protein n=1 Tax=Neobacillus mesonae TaxID=1193713 RepID=UPI00203A4FB9|nr:hypothetical protein [Neobacillus mesonae]MCM3568389.1 hypothetical protein [Neobacillus mesonae]